ncbi:hypothetical protein PtB15_4B189 [Puccinia triticina]|nr:hypothetical protein PtB15_4B189 [Puccinia triticina]
MTESLAGQDIADSDVLKTFVLQALTNASENSNPYYTAALHIHNLMDQRAPLTAVSIVDATGPLPPWVVVLPSIFLILFGADSRFLILSIEWLPCFLAGWVFLWGLGSGVFEAAYGLGLPLVVHKASAWGFNFVALMLPLIMSISQMVTFIIAQKNLVEAINVGNSVQAELEKGARYFDPKNFNATADILPKLIPIRNMIPHEIKLANYLITGQMMWIVWAVVLLVLTVPLVTLHLKTLKDTIQKIASECEIDLDPSSLTIFELQATQDKPFSGPSLSTVSAKQQKSADLLHRFRKERRANKISLAIFLSYLSVYLILCIANKATSSMNQSDHGAKSAIGLLIAGKATAAILGLLITVQFYRKIRSGSQEALARGTGSAFGAGMQFHKEVAMIIEDAALRRVGETNQSNYVKYEEW